ncbi:MAG: hypothetical protein WAK95_03495 [Desulfobacterales bacterium]
MAAKEKSVSIASEIQNAVIDFSQMAVSVLVLLAVVIRGGKPIVDAGGSRKTPLVRQPPSSSLLKRESSNCDPSRYMVECSGFP